MVPFRIAHARLPDPGDEHGSSLHQFATGRNGSSHAGADPPAWEPWSMGQFTARRNWASGRPLTSSVGNQP
jgi:hypothetical protein